MIALFLLLAALAQAQTVNYAVTATLAWDAPTTLASGGLIPAGDTLSYEIGREPAPVSAAARAAPTGVGVSTSTTASVTVPADSRSYAYAVRSKLVTDGGATTLYSAWVWSDQAGVPGPFVLRRPSTDSPGPPGRLRL